MTQAFAPTGMAGTNINTSAITNQLMPVNGRPTSVPFYFDFTAATSFFIDLTSAQWQQKITGVQSVFADNRGGTAPLLITDVGSGQIVGIPPGAQGFVPLLVPQPAQLTVSCANGSAGTTIILLNIPMPCAIWYPNQSTPTYVSGSLQTQDVGIQSALGGMPLAVQSPKIVLTSRSTTSVATPASTQLMPAATYRKYLTIQAPTTSDLWVNPNGGAAGVAATDCIRIPAGSLYESAQGVWQGVINYYCATGGLAIAAFEGA